MKKFATWFLAMILCISFSLSVLAADTESQAEEGETEATEAAVTILYTNDIHTYITEDLTYSMVAGYRDTLDNVLLVDAGDHIQGTAYGSMDNGETIIEIMNAAGYDLATLGNHEFDYGMDGALQAVEWADFPYVSCNFYHEENGVVGENVLDSYQVFEVNDVKIAFVGITTPDTFSKSTPKYFQDEDGNYIYGIAGGSDGTELYESVQTAIDEASKEADLVIALGHLGVDPSSIPWTSEEVIANTTGLDAFIDGHSHTTMEGEYVTDKDGNEVLLTQTGYYFSALGQMTITINETDTDETDTTAFNITTELLTAEDLTDVTPNTEVETIEQEWIAEIDEQLGEQIAESDIEFTVNDADGNRLIRMGETNMGDFNADAYYWYMNEADGIGCDIAIMNGGGIRATIEAGEWTYLTCKNINPFGNVLCVVEASGQDILDALEYGARYTPTAETGGFMHVAGLMYEIDTSIESTVQADENETWVSGPTEEYRVQNVKVYNKETGEYEDLVLDQMYSVAGTNYTLRNCGDGFDMFSDVELVKDYIVEDYMALAAYAMSVTDSDGNGYSNLSTENCPLSAYEGYLLTYDDIAGSGRIPVYYGTDESTGGDTSGTTDTTETAKTTKKYTIGNAKYKITSSNTVSFVGVVKQKKTVTIPSSVTINGKKYRVTAIAAKAFKGDKKIRKVVIPSTVQKIGKKAISGINKKATIKVPKGKKAAYKKLFKTKTGYKKTMKIKVKA
ncbi:MAG: 5'-nucleotidase C-terminal domain-containing protein [Clostridiales bacterium]|nr:5'-nucleotidase C-terminal domain-containing protein [Clostridiales bacterium]